MKKIMHRFLPFLLCMELIFTNIMPITIQAQASELPNVDQEELNIEPEVSQEISDEKNSGNGETTPGTTEDESGNEETEPGTTEDEGVNEETEPGTTEDENGNEETEPGTTEDEGGNEDTEPEITEDEGVNEETEPETSEDEGVNEETEPETSEDESENEDEDEDTEAVATEEFIAEDALTSEDDIASGKYGNITWNIDAEGKLTVNGTGDFCPANKQGINRAPWYNYADKIKSAEISVTGMADASYMFYGCKYLAKVDFSGSDTGSVTNMSHMFQNSSTGVSSILSSTPLDFSNLDTGNVTDMSYMFYNHGMNALDLSGCDTKNVKNMSHMFEACGARMDLRGLDTGNVTDMSYMFYRSNRVYEDVGSFDTGNVTDMSYMFANSYVEGKALNLDGFTTSKVTNMSYMFSECHAEIIDLRSFDTSSVTDMSHMFSSCSVKNLDVSNLDFSNVTNMKYTFQAYDMISLNISGFNPKKMTDLSALFDYCKRLEHIDLSDWDVSNVTDMSYMFRSCESLTSIDLSGLDTGNVQNMDSMFSDCYSLTSLDLSGFDTGNVTNMGAMFASCRSLTDLDLSSFDTRNVQYMYMMFFNCPSLTELDLSSFDTENLTSMWSMFAWCNSLTTLDLSSFNLEKLSLGELSSSIFEDCDSLTTIYAPYNISLEVYEALNPVDEPWEFLNLPSGNWYDANGNKYTKLPHSTTCSILLTKNTIPSVYRNLKVKKTKTVYECGEEVTLDDLTVIYNGNDGSVRKLGNTEYRTNVDEINADMYTSGIKTLKVTYENNDSILTAKIALNVGTSLEMANVTVTLPEETYVYDGTYKRPVPTVTITRDNEVKVLKEGTDYTVTYLNNTDAYEGSLTEADLNNVPTVIINGKGDYNGTLIQAFQINKAAAPKNERRIAYAYGCDYKRSWRIYDMSDTFKFYGPKTQYRIDTVTDPGILTCNPRISADGLLMYCTNEGFYDNSIIFAVNVSFKNYEDAAVYIEVVMKRQEQAVISGIVMPDSVYTGEKVSYSGIMRLELSYETVVVDETTDRWICKFSYKGIQADGTPYGYDEDEMEEDVKESQSAPVNAGKYIMTVEVTDSYAGKYAGIREYPFEILPAPVTIRPVDKAIVRGSSLPKLDEYEYQVSGLLNDDKLIKEPTCTYNVPEESIDLYNFGMYEVIPQNADAGMNYNIKYENGRLFIAEENYVYTVSFDLCGHGNEDNQIDTIFVKPGGLIDEPNKPVARGYTFAGWYKDRTFDSAKAWDFGTDTVQSDITLYACWLVNAAEDDEEGLQLCIMDIEPQYYTGKAVKPSIVVYDSNGTTMLKAGKDYTVKYASNTDAVRADRNGKLPLIGTANVINAGKRDEKIQSISGSFSKGYPYVIITGKGNYSGTVYKNFYILPKDISSEDKDGNMTLASGITLKYNEQLLKNNKKTQKPLSSIKYKKAMKLGTDYMITLEAGSDVRQDDSYFDSDSTDEDYVYIEPYEWSARTEYNERTKKYTAPAIPKAYYGTFLMTVTGMGNYKGTIKKNIYVTENAGSLIKNASITLGKNQKKLKFEENTTLTPGFYDADKANYYTLKGGEYDVVSKDDIFMVSVKAGKKVNYLKYDSKNKENRDYFVSYQNNDTVGTATMTITGNPEKGYYGSKSITFKITGAAFSAKTVAVKAYSPENADQADGFMTSMSYTGKALTQNKVILTTKDDRAETLVYGTHYTINYKNNLKKGTATMTFIGNPKSGYSGSFKKTFKITPQNLSDVEFDGQKKADYSQNGAKLNFILRNAENMELQQGKDYAVSYKNNKTVTQDAGNVANLPTMFIKGKGNYTGTMAITFEIQKTDVGTAINTGNLKVSTAYVARKDNMKFSDFKFKIFDGKKALSMGERKDYVLDFTNCTDAMIQAYADALRQNKEDGSGVAVSEPMVKIKGVGNYSGEADISLTDFICLEKLTAKNLYVVISDYADQTAYTGEQVRPEVTVYYGTASAVKAAKRQKETNDDTLTDVTGTYAFTRLKPKTEAAGETGDYILVYGNNITSGKNKGSMIINGIGILGGSVTVKFDILKRGIFLYGRIYNV